MAQTESVKQRFLRQSWGWLQSTPAKSGSRVRISRTIPPYERTKMGIGYMPQTGNIFSKLTVEDNLKMAAYTVNNTKMYHDKLEFVWNLFPMIKEYMPRAAGTLSGGERQMLAEGMVLMREPKLMMVDEPTAGLMPKLVNDVMKQLEQMAETTGSPHRPRRAARQTRPPSRG